MSSYSGPSIVTSGLIFEFDMANASKSWMGAPVTNSQWNGGSEVVPGTVSGINTDVTGTSYQGPVTTAKTWKFTKTGGSNQWNGWEATYSGVWSGSSGDVWTTSYWYKTSAPAGVSGFGIGSFYLPDWSRAYNTTVLSSVSSIIPDGQWHYNYTTVQFNEAYSNAIIADGPSWGYSTQAGELFINGLQWNKNNYAARFATGTRTNTQAIVDLRGNTTITASNLTYSSDDTFSFDYANSSHLSIPLATSFNKTQGTMNFWVYPTRYNGGNGYFVNREDATPNAADWFWIGPYSNTFYFRLGNGSDCCSNDLSFGNVSTVIPLNTWTNMCFTWVANGTSAIYKNGVLYTSRSIGNVPATNPASNGRIGLGHANADNYFHGKMSSVSIYNRALSAAEILQNFNAMRGRYGL